MRPPGRKPGRLARIFGRRAAPEAVVLVDDGSLVLIARAFEVERGDAAVLDEISTGGHDLAEPMLLRHVFRVRADGDSRDLELLRGGLQADGYDVEQASNGALTASSTLVLTVLATAQARARMTGLTTRYPVDYVGWEALARPVGA
jgi:hypothetical protein